MRLIDADALIEALAKLPPHAFYSTEFIKTMVIDEEPTVDMVDVVRCRDCRYFATYDDDEECGCCSIVVMGRSADAYCSYGKRR